MHRILVKVTDIQKLSIKGIVILNLPFLGSLKILSRIRRKSARQMEFWSIISYSYYITQSEIRLVVSDSLRPDSPGQNTRVGSLSFLQGIFPTHGSNPRLPHCRRILYQLSHNGNPKILEWVDYPFFSGSSQRRNWTGVSCIAGGFFTNWAIRKAWHITQCSYIFTEDLHVPGTVLAILWEHVGKGKGQSQFAIIW